MREWLRKRWVKRTLLGAGVLAGIVVLLAGMVTVWLLGEDSGSVSLHARSTGDDALWLGHAWVDGRKGPGDVAALAVRLRGTGIRDLFVHTGPLSDDGTLHAALRPRAGWLVAALHRALPGVRVQAWLGDLVGAGHLDLASAATRRHVITSVSQVLSEGFDGIHFDLEPVSTGDPGYLVLLRQAHMVTRQEARILSVATAQVEPLGMLHPFPVRSPPGR